MIPPPPHPAPEFLWCGLQRHSTKYSVKSEGRQLFSGESEAMSARWSRSTQWWIMWAVCAFDRWLECYFTPGLFLPKTHTLDLIENSHQKNSNWGMFCKRPDYGFLELSSFQKRKPKKLSTKRSQWGPRTAKTLGKNSGSLKCVGLIILYPYWLTKLW